MKYNLTFRQKLYLPMMWLAWFGADPDKRKTWHEVKKGMEKHECDFIVPFTEGGYKYLKCGHEGCYTCEPVD